MSLAVVDASVLAAYYAATGLRLPRTVDIIAAGDVLSAPAHLDAEIVSAVPST